MRQIVLNKFDVGIINSVAASKVGMDAATDLLDADISFADLRPFKEDALASSIPTKLSLQDGNRSIARFGNHYIWSNNSTGELDSTLGYVGVEPPSSSVTLAFGARGNKFTGRYRYTCTFETPEGVESAPAVVGSVYGISAATEINALPFTETITQTVIEQSATAAPFDIYHTVVSAPTALGARYNPRVIPSFSSTVRYGYSEGELVSYNGRTYKALVTFTSVYSPGTPTPSRDGSVAIHSSQYPGNATLWQDLTTSLTDNSVVQSEWSGYDSILLTNIPVSTEGAVTKVNIYRTVGDGSEFFRIASLPSGTLSFRDTISDSAAVTSTPLSFLPIFPPVREFVSGGMSDLPCKFLTDQLELFYVASGRRVYISEQGNPHAWDVRKFLELEDDCTGIARYRDGVLAFTRNRTYQITGSTLADIQLKWIPEYQGCKDWRTISYMNNSPTWISNDGLCQYGFVPQVQAELLQNLTAKKYNWPTIIWAFVATRKYYGITDDGRAVIYDFESEGAISTISLNATYGDYDADNDAIIYKSPDGNFYRLFGADTNREWTYTSPILNLSTQYMAPGLRRVRSAFLRCTEDCSISVQLDGVDKTPVTSEFSTPFRRVFFAPGMTGSQIRITVQSKGILDHIALEWEELRKNG